MTGKQIKAAQKALPEYKDLTSKQYRQLAELLCREEINSCFLYGTANCNFYNPETKRFGPYAADFIKVLGRKTVIKLYNEQAEDFSQAIVIREEDWDGNYDYCIWADEQKTTEP